MLIDCNIDVSMSESEGAMGKNGERIILKNYSIKFFTLKLIMNMALVLNKGWIANYTFKLKKLHEEKFDRTLFFQFLYPWSFSKLQILGVSDSSPKT